jgi:hypothetical protein
VWFFARYDPSGLRTGDSVVLEFGSANGTCSVSRQESTGGLAEIDGFTVLTALMGTAPVSSDLTAAYKSSDGTLLARSACRKVTWVAPT